MTLTIIDLHSLYHGFLKLFRARLSASDGAVFDREFEDRGQAAAVLPYDPQRRTALMVRLPRAPPLYAEGVQSLLEAPAGLLDGDEDPEACARREALEETGAALGVLEPVARAWSSPGVSTERIHLYLAAYHADDRIHPGGGLADEHERITVEEMKLDDLWAGAERGEIDDLKTLCLLFALRLRRPDLFQG